MNRLADQATVAKLFDDVRALAPLIRDVQEESDRLGRMPDSLVQAFVRLNLFRCGLPQHLGGIGLEPVTWLRLIEEMSFMDGSVGWNLAISSQGAGFAAILGPEVAPKVFDGPGACVVSALNPTGRAQPVDGGYSLSGRWAFGSGIDHGTWVGTAALIFDGDTQRLNENGSPASGFFLVPREDVTALDTWHVGGMRGTGSNDFLIKDVFVPHERTQDRTATVVLWPSSEDPLLRLGTFLFGVNLCCVALGVARCAIEGVIELAAGKPGTPVRPRLSERQAAQYDVAKAQVLLESAKVHLLGLVEELWQTILAEEEWGADRRVRLRQAAVHASETATQVVDMMYRVAGGTALYESSPFERCLRDVHAVQAHVLLQRDIMEDAGRILFGLEPRMPAF